MATLKSTPSKHPQTTQAAAKVVAKAVEAGGVRYRYTDGGTPPRALDDFTNDEVLRFASTKPGAGPKSDALLLERYALLRKSFTGDFTVAQALALFTAQQPKLRRRRESLRGLLHGGHLVFVSRRAR